MENTKEKSLQLLSKVETYTKDGASREYVKYYVIVNGIELVLSPSDNTVRQVLTQYFKGV